MTETKSREPALLTKSVMVLLTPLPLADFSLPSRQRSRASPDHGPSTASEAAVSRSSGSMNSWLHVMLDLRAARVVQRFRLALRNLDSIATTDPIDRAVSS